MRPIKYTINKGVEVFHYSFKNLREFIEQGNTHGDVGLLLISRDPVTKFITYKGYGTIENPTTTRRSVHIKHFSLFDGGWRTPEDIINPPPTTNLLESSHFVILDMSDYQGKPNIHVHGK